MKQRMDVPTEARQDRAKCMGCDWSFGWNLEYNRVEQYANDHRQATGHQLDYRIEFITTTEHRYIIGAKDGPSPQMNEPTYHPKGGWHFEVHKPGGPYTADDPLTRWWKAAKQILHKINQQSRWKR